MRAGLFGARGFVSVTLAFIAPLVASLGAQQASSPTPQPSKLTLEQYFDLEDVQDPRLSPDGKQVIYTRRWVDKLNDRWESSLWIMNADGSRNRHLLDGLERDLVARRHRASPTSREVSRAGRRSGCGSWTARQRRRRSRGSPSRRRTFEWSPDGKSLAFRMLVMEKDDWTDRDAGGAERREVGRGAARRHPAQLSPRSPGLRRQWLSTALPRSGRRRHGASGNERAVGAWCGRVDRATGSHSSSPRSAPKMRSTRGASRRSTRSTSRRGRSRQLTNRKGPDGNPSVSPTGSSSRTPATIRPTRRIRTPKLYVMNADGSNRRVLTEALDRSPQGIIWAPDESGVYFNAESEGWRNLYFAPARRRPRASDHEGRRRCFR